MFTIHIFRLRKYNYNHQSFSFAHFLMFNLMCVVYAYCIWIDITYFSPQRQSSNQTAYLKQPLVLLSALSPSQIVHQVIRICKAFPIAHIFPHLSFILNSAPGYTHSPGAPLYNVGEEIFIILMIDWYIMENKIFNKSTC